MPVQIHMAEPADLAGEYLHGVQVSSQIREAQQRLQAQQQETDARLRAESERQQQEHAVQQQRIQVTQQYQQQQIALRKEQLAAAAQVNAQKTQSAARQYQAKQAWQTGLDQIDKNDALNPEQKDAARSSLIMRLAPMMGTPGTEAAAMLKDFRPPKPTVPASVNDKGDVKPGTSKAEPTVQVKVSGDQGGVLKVPQSRARALVAGLPAEMADDPINKAAMAIAPATPYSRDSGAASPKASAPAKRSAPKVGDVYKGHKFLGGNPNDEKNWEKVD